MGIPGAGKGAWEWVFPRSRLRNQALDLFQPPHGVLLTQ